MDYKATLNLPHTSFPMKANLPQKEVEILKFWGQISIYQKIRERSHHREKFILHDGPPYANGHIHLGTALNKILKDIIVKHKIMTGKDAAYVPGWDCHGLPIEHEVDKLLQKKKKKVDRVTLRSKCRAYAEKFIDIQKSEFKRLGVIADWENPYLTFDPMYEATVVTELAKFVEKDMVYRGYKPVFWCMSCQTALAEAEVEYMEHESSSIYVKFPVVSFEKLFKRVKQKSASVIIWTTTPWTLPANMAIALHPCYEYVVADMGDEYFVLAKALMDAFESTTGLKIHRRTKTFTGEQLSGMICKHPFVNREVPTLMGEFVTLEQGTGCVHIAPGHGIDDYNLGQKYDLPVFSPVDSKGRFMEEAGELTGMKIQDANPVIIDILAKNRNLVFQGKTAHSYPHCWRCKKPVIFRATNQWFISLDSNGLRAKALQEVKNVKWIPPWGEKRIYGMISNRPDWCISRQRAWGVPIIAFYCRNCNHTIMNKEVMDYVASKIASCGVDIWFTDPVKDILPPGFVCPACGCPDLEKENNIIDVWFESGASHVAVAQKHPDLSWPVDMYLEGSDQHRGWFHSSFLISMANYHRAPYRAVLTHGFIVDGQGRKMSKSLRNVIEPREIIDKLGAEILRLFVVSEDYREDVRISKKTVDRLTEAYRRIRNTCRFILGNIDDFDPGLHFVPYEERHELDKWILHKLQGLVEKARNSYELYEFHTIYHSLYNFCTIELSSLYLDILKDRLYTSKPQSHFRRSAQSTLYELLFALVQLMTPVLSFTAEEIWQCYFAGKTGIESVLLTDFPVPCDKYLDESLASRFEKLLLLREGVAKALEIARQDKIIGHSLDAKVILYVPTSLKNFFMSYKDFLHVFFITSGVEIHDDNEDNPIGVYTSEEIDGLFIYVEKAEGKKCERCWTHSTTVGLTKEHPSLCKRCVAAIN